MSPPPRSALEIYLRTLVPSGDDPAFFEIRHVRPGGGMGRRFVSTRDVGGAALQIAALAGRTDVYIGVAPRARRSGTRSAIAHGWVLWADCDTAAATNAALTFGIPPSIVITSGSPGAIHAYWALSRPASPDELERGNQGLATLLGSDPQCVDAPRILRPPETLNHKHVPPSPVRLVAYRAERHELTELPSRLPVRQDRRPSATLIRQRDDDADSRVRRIPPPDYVRVLLGQAVDTSGKVRCPFHSDEHPSLHVYDTPERGWYCFQCGAGGSIYDLAGRLWNMPLRGESFIALADRLAAQFE